MMVVQTALVLLAFAANSLLCRWALREYSFDSESFTIIRLVAGAVILSVLLWYQNIRLGSRNCVCPNSRRFWLLGLGLFVYASAFSMAYVSLDTGVGAFVLFATVQLGLQWVNIWRGARPGAWQLVGMLVSITGLALLLLPGSALSSWWAVLLMVTAALGWTGFVVLGQGSSTPLADVQAAFVAASLLSILLIPFTVEPELSNWRPLLLAVISGAIASGLGYFGWYRVLPWLGIHRAAQVQLLVPGLAVLMGALVLSERLTTLMLLAMGLIVAGVLIAIRARRSVDT
ncbi:DMT family transporter [Candidatus Thalassolituus haligoni]|jgi:drug/metabolite transporter (DMT)-like permease|uniref:DMT family transporter n=1 Tax=Candidatus Thalassolituus haligoni TaxID=3100113 RepID=UPI003518E7EE|tara:strand:- start:15454 stop:16314 length:861 start_codon:yes stop_codon:yes gene_type:complete